MMAYSLRRLRTDYSGYCIDVQRSSDNAVQSFGFKADQVDIVAVQAFVGVGNGFINKWYDQSGNGRHVVNSVPGAQISIIITGVVNVLYNSRPSISFSGAGAHLSFTTTSNRIITSGLYGIAVSRMTVNKVSTRVFELSGTVDASTADNVGWTGGGVALLLNVVTDLVVTQSNRPNTLRGGSYFVIGRDMLHNGSPPYYATGYGTGTAATLQGYISEIVIFNYTYSAMRISGLVSNMRSYYGTTN
jgi:hypothetical protein